MDREFVPDDSDLGLDDCCPECGGEGGHLACIEDCCSCASGDECWVSCNVCGGEG